MIPTMESRCIMLEPAFLGTLALLIRRARSKSMKQKLIRLARRGDLLSPSWIERLWIPISDKAWLELCRPEVYNLNSWDAKRFHSIYGVPKVIFDELVHEACQHKELFGGKTELGDGRRGPVPKPVELKVAAVLEMCQAGLTFKTAGDRFRLHSGGASVPDAHASVSRLLARSRKGRTDIITIITTITTIPFNTITITTAITTTSHLRYTIWRSILYGCFCLSP